MNILISNKILIKDANAPFKRWVRQNYTIPNPEYITKVRLNKWIGKTPRNLKLYEEYPEHDLIILPYGCLQAMYMYLIQTSDISTAVIDRELNVDRRADWSTDTKIIPRDYQEKAVNQMLYHKYGILKAPCSSGKTVMGHLIAKGTGMRTLWLTHTKELLNQSKAIGELMLGKDNGKVGTITDGKVNPGSVITYATVQTMAKLDPKDYKREYNCVICDEVHRVCKSVTSYTQFSWVLNNVAAEYKYGLSATPEVHNGYGKTVFCNVGDIKYEITKDILEENETIMPVVVHPIYTNWKYPKEAMKANGVVDFDKAVKFLISDEERNDKIVSLIGDKPTLVLSNNIDHLCYIANRLSEEQASKACLVSTKHDIEVPVLCKHTDKARAEYIEKLRSGELDIMFATYQLAKEGLNIPRLEQVILAYPAVDSNIITQSVGRVARCCDGKYRARCYDLIDSTGYFIKLWKKRKSLYIKNGNEII